MRGQFTLLSTLVIFLFTSAALAAGGGGAGPAPTIFSGTNRAALDTATFYTADWPGSAPATFFTANWPAPDTARVTVLEGALLDRLNAATVSIDAALYDFSRPSLRDALLAAHARGVQVRIVTDDQARASAASGPFYGALQAAGILLVDDGDETRIMHDKYAIIDHRVVWTGSTNWSENDIARNHNNALAFTSPEVAGVFQYDFDQMWTGRFGGAKIASPTTTLTYDGSPLEIYFSPQDNALDQVIAEVNAAQQSVDFAIFFFTDDRLRDALTAARARGVLVRGIFDELGAGNASSDDESLCEAGVQVGLEQTAGKMHNKLMIIDAAGTDPRVITGSLNWTAAGDRRNSENIAIVHNEEAAQAYASAFAQWWAGALYLSCGIQVPRYNLYLPVVVRGIETVAAPVPTPPATAIPTATAFPTATPQPAGPCNCSGNLYNCTDFATQGAAQACFDWCMQQVGADVHGLDSDGDGVVCEGLPLRWRVYGAASEE